MDLIPVKPVNEMEATVTEIYRNPQVRRVWNWEMFTADVMLSAAWHMKKII